MTFPKGREVGNLRNIIAIIRKLTNRDGFIEARPLIDIVNNVLLAVTPPMYNAIDGARTAVSSAASQVADAGKSLQHQLAGTARSAQNHAASFLDGPAHILAAGKAALNSHLGTANRFANYANDGAHAVNNMFGELGTGFFDSLTAAHKSFAGRSPVAEQPSSVRRSRRQHN